MATDSAIHFILGHKNPKAAEAFAFLTRRYGQVPEGQGKTLVVLGGDGTVLDVARGEVETDRQRPIYGINYGSLGFLLNEPLAETDDLHEILAQATATRFHPLIAEAEDLQGRHLVGHSINEMTIDHADPSKVVHLIVRASEELVYPRLWSNGIVVSTPIGSTGYSLSVGGDIVPPDSNLMLLSPIAAMPLIEPPCPPLRFAPRPIVIEVEEPDWRRTNLSRDTGVLLRDVTRITIRQDRAKTVTFLHRADSPLRERYANAARKIRRDRAAAAQNQPNLF